MEVTLSKESINTAEVLCTKYNQTLVESDIIVPDVKPDIAKILDVNGTVSMTQKNIQQDKAYIQGTVKITVLYLPDGDVVGRVKSLTATQDFNHTIDARGAEPDMDLYAEAEAESFDYSLINSRKLNLRCVLGIGAKISKPSRLAVAASVDGDQPIEVKCEKLRVMNTAAYANNQIVLREQLDLPAGKPAIGELLKITACPVSMELRMMEKKAVAKGQVNFSTLYSADDDKGSIQFMEHTIPFTEILDVDGAIDDMEGDVEYTVKDLFYDIKEDNDGEPRILSVELILEAAVRGNEVMEIAAISDAYALKGDAELNKKRFPIEQLIDNSTGQIPIKDSAHTPPMLPPIMQLCNLSAVPKIDRVTVEDDTITVHGVIDSNILYMTADENTPMCSFKHSTEFSKEFQMPGADRNTVCDTKVMLDHAGYTLTNGGIDLRFVLDISIKAVKTGDVELVDNITLTETEQPAESCIILYFVQQGDTLWDIAKRYRTTVEQLKKENGLDSDLINIGQQIKIMPR